MHVLCALPVAIDISSRASSVLTVQGGCWTFSPYVQNIQFICQMQVLWHQLHYTYPISPFEALELMRNSIPFSSPNNTCLLVAKPR